MACRYAEKTYGVSLGRFLLFMRLNTKWYLERIRKCFNIWLIDTYERGIDRANEQIVK
jgi:hypothetical protein